MSLTVLKEFLINMKGGPGSGHYNHSGRYGKSGGSRKGRIFRIPKPKKDTEDNDKKESKPNKKHKNPNKSYKGATGSGDWGHRGRPGKRGGSGGGGGLAPLGLDPSTPIEERREASRRVSEVRGTPTAQEDRLIKHYNLADSCKDDPDACDGLQDYTGPGYIGINDDLRSGMKIDESIYDEKIKNIDKAFEKFGNVPEDIKAFRVVGRDMVDKLQPGTEFQDKAFVSTSIKKGAFDILSDPINMEIRVPKGSKGIYVDTISSNPGEKELLLNRSSKFRVLKNDGNNVVVELING